MLVYTRAGFGEVVSERVQDLVGGLAPGERPGALVPGGDPVPDVVLRGLDRGAAGYLGLAIVRI